MVILNVLQSFTERDFKLRLWRKEAEVKENGVRKVRVMWTVRQLLTAVFTHHVFEMHLLHFQTLQPPSFPVKHTPYMSCCFMCTQEIPSTCQDTFTYTIKQTPYKDQGYYANTSCRNSICNMNQDAHRIYLTVFHDKTPFVEDSVYVPAIGESEF